MPGLDNPGSNGELTYAWHSAQGLGAINGVNSVPPTAPLLWIAGSSCELLGFPLTTSGSTPPTNDIEGPLTHLTSPGFGNAQSITWAPFIDGSRNIWGISTVQASAAPTVWKTSILRFAPDTTGNVAPDIVIEGAATHLDDFQDVNPPDHSQMGVCLDGSGNIYAATFDNFILKFPSGSNGNAASSFFVGPTANKIYASVFYDATRQWIWATTFAIAGGVAPATIEAYDLAGVQQRLITDTANLEEACQVYLSPIDQSIFVAERTGTGIFVYDKDANGQSSPTRNFFSANSQFPGGVAVDSGGLAYMSSFLYGTVTALVEVFAANADGAGTAVPLATMTATALHQTFDGTPTSPFALSIG